MIGPYRHGNRAAFGSTQSGKSYGAVWVILQAVFAGLAVLVLDPHTASLAWNSFLQLTAHGFSHRIIFDQLREISPAPGYRFGLRPSRAAHPLRRADENQQAAEGYSELLSRRRDQASLRLSPMTEEWTTKACLLLLNQPSEWPAHVLRYAFRVGHPIFQTLVAECLDPDIKHDFEQIADGTIRRGQYDAARRLIDAVCGSASFIARCGTTMDLPTFLGGKGILLVEGGGVSPQVTTTILGSIVLEVIHYVRTRLYPSPRILLVLDEATNAQLVSAAGHEARAMAECQKMGLDIYTIAQSLSFPTPQITEDVLSNSVIHEWYFTASSAVARRAADDLRDSQLANEISQLKTGERYVKDRNVVYRDKVPFIESPWVFPELTELKARRALDEIRKRPEFQLEPWNPGETVPHQIVVDTENTVPATPAVSHEPSPALRLRELVNTWRQTPR